jgi:predicted phage terminase large subunit-like protein
LKFLHLHLPSTNDSGAEAWFRDGYEGFVKNFGIYDALWPSRYSRTKLDEIAQVIHPYYKRAQFDLVPSLGELGYFDITKLLRFRHFLCEQCWIAVDAANTATATGSYTSFVALGSFEGVIKVLAVWRGRWRQDQMHQQLQEFYQHIFRLTGVMPEAVVVEQAAAGYGIIDMLSRLLPILPLYPRGSKEERASAVCWLVNTGRVAVPEAAAWLKDFLDEIENFPLCASKDTTDAFVHALAYASRPAEFKPRPLPTELVTYDTLEEDAGRSSFEEENDFDRRISNAERLLKP